MFSEPGCWPREDRPASRVPRPAPGAPEVRKSPCLTRSSHLVRRWIVALAQARGHLPQGLCRRPRGQGRHRGLDPVLQHAALPSGPRQSDTHAGLASGHGGRGCIGRGGCGDDGQRCRVDHIPTAAADNSLSGCIRERLTSGRSPISRPAPVVLPVGFTSLAQWSGVSSQPFQQASDVAGFTFVVAQHQRVSRR